MCGISSLARHEIYMWEPTLSPHKLPLYRALQKSNDPSRVVYISDQPLLEERSKQGWRSEVLSSDEIIISPSKENIREIVAQSTPDSVHIFSGLRNVPAIVEGLQACIAAKRHFGIMHEPRVLDVRGGLLRLTQSWFTESLLRRHAKFVLAIGAHGPQWFKIAGYRKASIFPFAYFIEKSSAPVSTGSADGRVRVGFLGRLERAKGLHVLLEASEQFSPHYILRVAGAGSLRAQVEQYEGAHPGRVEFVGKLDMAEVRAFLDELDILVLPSITRDDGWGVVVSEALQRGLSVVVAEPAGASACLAEPSILGRKVIANSPTAIVAAIDDIVALGENSMLARTERSSWAEKYLTAMHGAFYATQVIEYTVFSGLEPGDFLASRPLSGALSADIRDI